MKIPKLLRLHACTTIALLAFNSASAHDPNAPLDESQKKFLAQYELMHAALAADDLDGAKQAAAVVAQMTVLIKNPEGEMVSPAYVREARQFADAKSLDEARDLFKPYSERAIHYGEHKPGFYVVKCPKWKNGDARWLQITQAISNPYLGKRAPTCGTMLDNATPESR